MSEMVVIGGGPAGVTAALRARELGSSVTLVERRRMGGTCTNDGCVPTRVLARAARLVRDAEQFADYGLEGAAPKVDFPKVLQSTRRIVEEVHDKKSPRERLEGAGVEVHEGVEESYFVDANTLSLGGSSRISADRFVICAGGQARRLEFPGSEYALTHNGVWEMEALPGSIAIVGAAATGCQLASVFASFGSEVHLLEIAPRILAGEDEVVSRVMDESFRQGMNVETGIGGIDRIEKATEGYRLVYLEGDGRTERVVAVDAVVLSVGWPGNLAALDLPAAGVRTEGGYIAVDDALQTTAPNIFAAGDVTGRMMLVQSATFEGSVAAERAVLGGEVGYRHEIVPHGGFTDPEYGSVGLDEEAARASYRCTVASVPYADLDRGVIDGRQEGFCKLIVEDDSHRILGAHIVGEQAVEVVQIVATAMRAGMRVEELADVELAYPTFTAIVGLSARRIARELGLIPDAPQPNLRGRLGIAEWELGRDPAAADAGAT